ncbi:endolytic transglycosylase MltG [Streptomyces phaeochromogenes]|uniref:endolytic transglycosylase MltG n=1 Tax=Streptomyces phaeochromogenes TaxID=1923 RepID=UPI0033E98D1A
MTDYSQGHGSDAWHPEDPLYGDGGWEGQAHEGQSPYGGQPQHYPQQQYGDWAPGQQAGYDQGQQQYTQGHQQHYAQDQQYGGQVPQHYNGQSPQQYNGQGGQQYDNGQSYHDQGGQQYNGGWAPGQQQQPHQPQPQVPYGVDPNDPYGGQAAAYGGQQSDYYGTPDAYPPPEPPSRRRAEHEPQPADWDSGPDQGEHAFFAGGNDDDDDDLDDDKGRRRSKGGKEGKGKGEKKRRSGGACLVVTLAFTGVIGGVGYFGYQFYQDRFGSAPDFAGRGNGQQVTVVIPRGAGGYVIGQKLKAAGVVQSVDAFVDAQSSNPNGKTLQDGVYTMQKQMSASSAVELMLSPKSRSNLVLQEGIRNDEVYKLVDARLQITPGTTKNVAQDDYKKLGLPEWALEHPNVKDPLEGFLYPSSYAVAKGMKPRDVLKQMVGRANVEYNKLDLEAEAEKLNLDDPWQVLTVASLVQAEGKYKHDFEKVARVVYNRLKPNNTETYGLLDFDSTVNYLRGESKLATGSVNALRKIDDPYNTYKNKGLPPGPIGNPGSVAIESALHPADGDWYYFVSVSEDKTLFAVTNEEHNRNREKYLEGQKE